MTLQELREARMKATVAARTIMDAAKKENRDLTDAENVQGDAAFGEVDRLKKEIDKLEQSEARKARLAQEERELSESAGRRTDPANPRGADPAPPTDGNRDANADYTYEFRRRGAKPVTVRYRAGSAEHRRHTPGYRAAFRDALAYEARALQADLDTAGGFIVSPEEFVAELLQDVDDEVMIRGMARKFTTNAQSIGMPRRTAKMASFAWGSELSTPTADTSLKFGKRNLTPHYMTGEIVVSRDLLRSGLMDVEAIVRSEIARDAGELEERAFISGSGAGQPLGLFTVSDDGITTARDVSSGNLATSITVDGLISAKFALKQVYRARAQWMFHRDAVAMIRKLKDGNGQYLWQPSVVAGEPDRILNLPSRESEWVPNTFTSGLYAGIIGDFSNYWIVDSLDMGIQVLLETYARTNQNGYIVRRKVDGAPTIAEAFARVKLG